MNPTDKGKAKFRPAEEVARLLAQARTASLATGLARDGSGWPYASLVLLAAHKALGPLLLLSDLADHTRNLQADQRAALLVTQSNPTGDPLSASRVTLLGRFWPVPEALAEDARDVFLARHGGAAAYADFKDFHLYNMAIEQAHLIAGFGRIHWLGAHELESAGILSARIPENRRP